MKFGGVVMSKHPMNPVLGVALPLLRWPLVLHPGLTWIAGVSSARQGPHQEGAVRELERMSRRKRQISADSGTPEHNIEIGGGRAVAVLCPEPGRCLV